MKFIPLVWAAIRRKLSRSLLILAQVVIAFALFGVLQGLTSGINHAIASAHADRLYVASKLDLGGQLPISMLEWLKSVPGVRDVTFRYQFRGNYQRPQQRVPVLATDVDSFFTTYTEYNVEPASAMRDIRQVQDGAIVGIGTMLRYGWKVGERVTLQSRMKREDGSGDWSFKILGTWANSEKQNPEESLLLVANYRYINESLPIGPARDNINAAVLRIDDPTRAAQIQQAIDSRYKNSSNETLTESEQALEQTRLMSLGDLDTVAHRIVGATFFVLLFATGALMMQSIRERTPELAVLKTLGFSDRRVMVLILAETLVLCLAGAALGLWLGMRLLPFASESIGTVEVPPSLFVLGFACAVLLALAGGGIAAWRGLRLRVADALANR